MCIDGRNHGIELVPESRLGLQQVDRRENPDTTADRLKVSSYLRRQLSQDPLNLAALLALKLTQLVVQVEACRGLNVDRLARCRGVMHEALHLPPRLGAHGDDHPAVAYRRLLFRGPSLRNRAPQLTHQRLAELRLTPRHLHSDPPEIIRRIIPHAAVRIHSARNPTLDFL